jgi:hypothetical protein
MKPAISLLLLAMAAFVHPDLKKSVENYQRKEVQSHYFFLNENQKVIYFEDSLGGVKCALYLQSQLETITDRKSPERQPVFQEGKPAIPAIFLNNTFISNASPLANADKWAPESVASFTLYDDEYMLISMMHLSYSITYNSIILKLDKSGHVRQQWQVATDEPLTGKMMGDDNGDHILDYRLNKETYTIEGNLKIK